MPATVIVERAANLWVDRARHYEVEINGEAAGFVWRGQCTSFEVPAGQVTVRARIDWTGSNTWTVDLDDGDNVTLLVEHERGSALIGLFSTNRYLSLMPK